MPTCDSCGQPATHQGRGQYALFTYCEDCWEGIKNLSDDPQVHEIEAEIVGRFSLAQQRKGAMLLVRSVYTLASIDPRTQSILDVERLLEHLSARYPESLAAKWYANAMQRPNQRGLFHREWQALNALLETPTHATIPL